MLWLSDSLRHSIPRAPDSHRLDETLADLERDLDPVDGEVVASMTEEACDCTSSEGRRPRRIHVRHGIGCEQLGQEVRVAVAHACGEAVRDDLPFTALRFDLGFRRPYDALRAEQQSLTGRFADADQARRLAPAPAEDVMKEECGTLHRQELFEQHEARQREGIRFGCAVGVGTVAVHLGFVGEDSVSAIGDSG